MGIENPIHLLFIAAVALIVLGPKRLPELARAVGKAAREFRESMNDGGSAHLGDGGSAQLGDSAGAKEPDDAAQSAPAPGSPDHRG
jgi:sec-independent protein translocase protein TatA